MGAKTKKKNLIVVGNKPPQKPGLANEIDSFDVVIRVNRMNYLGAAGNRIDCLYLEANDDFKYNYEGGANKAMIKKAKVIFMKKQWYERFDCWMQYLLPSQYNKIEFIDESITVKETGFQRLTSSILLLGHLINSSWSQEYNLHVTCLDVENRAVLIDNESTWGWHKGAGVPEQEYLLKQIKLNNLIRLHDE